LCEVNEDRTLWTVPKERMKRPREHIVPVTSRMRAILALPERRRAGERPDALICPGRAARWPISPSTPAAALRKIAGKRSRRVALERFGDWLVGRNSRRVVCRCGGNDAALRAGFQGRSGHG
jgi:integrase